MSYDVLIIGGGLGGLSLAKLLVRAGLKVCLIEKRKYPFHKVCGEYLSNELLPLINFLDLDIDALDASNISNFQISSPSGKSLKRELGLGGFGLSRYRLDSELANEAVKNGLELIENEKVISFSKEVDGFKVTLGKQKHEIKTKLLVGAYGKRSQLDKKLNRPFIKSRTEYVGVKYHIKYPFPKDLIALHNFKDGYCGISAIEDDRYCLCYLGNSKWLKHYGSIDEMESKLLRQNPYLDDIFANAQFLYKKPEVISQISFKPKKLVVGGVLMCGDSAGLITPLCGNGMTMAMHAALLLATEIKSHFNNSWSEEKLQERYREVWTKHFSLRITAGRQLQKLFGKKWLSDLSISAVSSMPGLLDYLIRQTHGKTEVVEQSIESFEKQN